MLPIHHGGLDSNRVRLLFPLPFVTIAWRSPHRSARSRQRLTQHHTSIAITNRCIVTLNRLYDSSYSLIPPSKFNPPSSRTPPGIPSLFEFTTHNVSPHPDTRGAPHAIGSAAQQRLLNNIHSHCMDFATQVRISLSSLRDGERCRDPCDLPHDDILTSWCFAPTNVVDVVTFEGPLPPTSDGSHPTSHPTASQSSSYSSSPTSVTPLMAGRVALPDSLNIVPFVNVLPPDVANTYHVSESSKLLRAPLEVYELNMFTPLRAPRVAGSRVEYIKLISRLHEQHMISFTASPMSVNGVFTVGKDEHHDRLIIDAQPANRLFVDPPHVALPDPSHLVQLQVPTDATMFVGKSDLSNYYHHLGLPEWMQPYFALPSLTERELRDTGISTSNGAVYPMCVTLPMGFSHAVYIAEMSHEHVLYSSGALSRDDNLMRMKSPLVRADRVLHGIVIDDFFTFCLNIDVATRQFKSVIDAYRRAGFVVKSSKVVLPTSDTIKVIGFNICGRESTICLPIESRVELVRATLSVLRDGIVTGIGLAHIIGRWTWCMLLRRSSLAILQHVYRFVTVANRRRFDIWPTVRRELWMLIGILPLLRFNFSSPMFHRIIASDASELAAGVVTTPLTDHMQKRMWPICSNRYHASVQAVLNSHSASTLSPDDTSVEHGVIRDMYDSYHAYYTDIVTSRWTTIISKAWCFDEHINALELRAVLLAVHWVLTYPSCITRRVYILVDSTVAFFTVWKGRSSSPQLLLILRKLSALLLSSDMSLLPGWIPSEVNPADGPSRMTSIGTVGNASS